MATTPSISEAQIVANMINTYTSLVTTIDDFNQGSAIRSAFEAFAQELRKLYQNMAGSAAETQRLAAYSMFGFSLVPAKAAYTMETLAVTIAPSTDKTIPAGTTVAVPGTSIQYKTPGAILWPAGSSSVLVRVVCTQTGTIGNQRAGSITQLVTPISGLSNVTVNNQRDVVTGTNLETEDQRANRFQEWVNSLHRGNTDSLVYGAKQASLTDPYGFIAEKVMKAKLVEGSGSNTIYIDNGSYDTSDELVTQCQKVIDGYVDSNGTIVSGYKAAGIPSTVMKADSQVLSLTLKVAPRTGFTFSMVKQSVQDSLINLVKSLEIGGTLTVSAVNLAIGNTPGVMNYQIVDMSSDVIPSEGVIIMWDNDQPNIIPL